MKKITMVLSFILILFLIFLINFTFFIKANISEDFYSNYYREKFIIDGKVKIILNNQTIFLLLFLENLDKNLYTIENEKIDQLFKSFDSIFNFSFNDSKFIKDLLNKYDLESFKNLSMTCLSNYVAAKNYLPNISVKFDNYEINKMQKEVDIFINNNKQLFEKFYDNLFKIIEDEFEKYFSFLKEDDISYFAKIAERNIFCIDFFISGQNKLGFAGSSENFNSFILISLNDNINDNYCIFIHENIHIFFHLSKFEDQIYKLCENNNLFFDIDKLIKIDKDNNIFYSYRGFKTILESKEEFYIKFIYQFFNEFFAHTFSSFILELKHNDKNLDKFLFINKDNINDDIMMKNLFELQTYLIENKNSVYFQFLNQAPTIEKVYKLFLLFLYSHLYNFDEVMNRLL